MMITAMTTAMASDTTTTTTTITVVLSLSGSVPWDTLFSEKNVWKIKLVKIKLYFF